MDDRSVHLLRDVKSDPGLLSASKVYTNDNTSASKQPLLASVVSVRGLYVWLSTYDGISTRNGQNGRNR